MRPALFSLVILKIRSCFLPRPAQTTIHFRLPNIADMIGAHHCIQLLVAMGSQRTPCLSWPGTAILQIPASQVARTSGVSHWCPVCFSYFSDRVSHFWPRLASNCNLPTSTSRIARIINIYHYTCLFFEMEAQSLYLFIYLFWPWLVSNHHPSISVSNIGNFKMVIQSAESEYLHFSRGLVTHCTAVRSLTCPSLSDTLPNSFSGSQGNFLPFSNLEN
jgi:hypothetical protein